MKGKAVWMQPARWKEIDKIFKIIYDIVWYDFIILEIYDLNDK